MSLTNPIPRGVREAVLTATAGQTQFGPADFLLYDAADLQVWYRQPEMAVTVRLEAGVTVTPAAPATGWPAYPIVTLAPQPEGTTVILRGVRVPERAADVTRNGTLQSQALERDLDKMVLAQQELRRDIDRGPSFLAPAAELVAVLSAAPGGISNIEAVLAAPGLVAGSAATATAAALSAAAWAEGHEPGGGGTKSAKEWANYVEGLQIAVIPFAFTGDGVETDFTLPAPPQFSANVRVAIAGIAQKAGTAFSIDGTTLSFVEAPPPGAPIFGDIIQAVTIDIGAPSPGSVTASSIDAGQAAAIRAVLDIPDQPASVAFSAHKNGVDQTGIASGTETKVTFGAEDFDLGGYYDAATSRFTPPAGIYRLQAYLYFAGGLVDQSDYGICFYRNGSKIKQRFLRASGTGLAGCEFSCLVTANGTDYFEVYGAAYGTGTKTINGNQSGTGFSGYAV